MIKTVEMCDLRVGMKVKLNLIVPLAVKETWISLSADVFLRVKWVDSLVLFSLSPRGKLSLRERGR